MPKKLQKLLAQSKVIIVEVLGSNKFFYFVLLVFVLQAGWIAVSTTYPMLYDEYYHPGLIDIYSRQTSPFITEQTPEQTAQYADITRNSSYLYHYLLSFPYRIIGLFTDSFMVAIILMRLINVMLVVLGIIFFRKLLKLIGFSPVVTNVSLGLLTLLPIFPFVAAHINYDNLLFPLTALFLVLSVKTYTSSQIKSVHLISMLSLGLLTSLVKYTFLPIFLTAFLVLLISVKNKIRIKSIELIREFSGKSVIVKIILLSLLFGSIGLFTERYVYNVIKYGNVTPPCHAVQSVEDCEKQVIYARSRLAEANRLPVKNLVEYTRTLWLPSMVELSLTTGAKVGAEESYNPIPQRTEWGLPIGSLLAGMWVIIFVSVIFVSYSFARLKKLKGFGLIACVVLAYFISVWIYANYRSYSKTGNAYAMQPRYFILIMPILISVVVHSLSISITSFKVKLTSLLIIGLLFTQGGGAISYIVRSEDDWFWRRDGIIEANQKARKLIAPLVKEK